MQAIILAGGKGTRVHAVYPDRPKALIPIAGKPFLQWQIEWLRRFNVSRIHIAAGHMAGHIKIWTQQSHPGITISEEPMALGTAGGLKFVEAHIRTDPFLVLNGDSLMPKLDFQTLEKSQRQSSNVWITMAVTEIQSAGRYGTVDFDRTGKVTAFREKATRDAGWINGGVYLVRRAALAEIEPNRSLSLETDIFPKLAKMERLHAFPVAPPLLDMGTVEGIQAMDSALRSGLTHA